MASERLSHRSLLRSASDRRIEDELAEKPTKYGIEISGFGTVMARGRRLRADDGGRIPAKATSKLEE